MTEREFVTDEMIQAGVDAALQEWREIVAAQYPELDPEGVIPRDLADEVRAHQARLIRAALAEVVPLVVERCAAVVEDMPAANSDVAEFRANAAAAIRHRAS